MLKAIFTDGKQLQPLEYCHVALLMKTSAWLYDGYKTTLSEQQAKKLSSMIGSKQTIDSTLDINMNKTIVTWMGENLKDLSKEELIKVVEYLAKQMEDLRQDRDRWRKSGNALEYLMHIN